MKINKVYNVGVIKTKIMGCLFIPIFLLFNFSGSAQNKLSIEKVSVKNCKIKFSLKNNSLTDFELPDVCVANLNGSCIPELSTLLGDTLEVNLQFESNGFQTSHKLNDSVYVKGKRVRSRRQFIKAGKKLDFVIPSHENLKIKFIKILLLNNQILWKEIP